jgi:hypothetical protein
MSDCYNQERDLYKLYSTVVRDKKYARSVQVKNYVMVYF